MSLLQRLHSNPSFLPHYKIKYSIYNNFARIIQKYQLYQLLIINDGIELMRFDSSTLEYNKNDLYINNTIFDLYDAKVLYQLLLITKSIPLNADTSINLFADADKYLDYIGTSFQKIINPDLYIYDLVVSKRASIDEIYCIPSDRLYNDIFKDLQRYLSMMYNLGYTSQYFLLKNISNIISGKYALLHISETREAYFQNIQHYTLKYTALADYLFVCLLSILKKYDYFYLQVDTQYPLYNELFQKCILNNLIWKCCITYTEKWKDSIEISEIKEVYIVGDLLNALCEYKKKYDIVSIQYIQGNKTKFTKTLKKLNLSI